ncbi:MAG: diguanylate cyclase [Clostridium sp.]
MSNHKLCGIIGITDAGQPIVTSCHRCPHFEEHVALVPTIKECAYCKFADFHKSNDIALKQSICRCPQNQVAINESERNETEQQPSPQLEKFVSNIKGGIITCVFSQKTKSSKAIYINAGWTAITGYTLDDLNRELDGNPHGLIYPDDKETADREYSEQIQTGHEYTLLYRVIHKNGGTIWVIDRGIVKVLSNGDLQNQSIVTEVTEIKEQEERLRQLAQLDQLTDLYNKVTFMQQTQMTLLRQYDKVHALLMIDIDNFKAINDRFGHAYGDKVLKAVADCLKGQFRNRDLIGRIGGDEFMILMTDIPDEDLIAWKANNLCATICDIRMDNGERLFISISLGVTMSHSGSTYDELFAEADQALYQAKSNGKNQYSFFKK